MNKMPGGSIESVIKKFVYVSETLVINYTRQILTALVALHDEKMIHGNLKASNILIDQNGNIKLSDMNIFKVSFTSIGEIRNVNMAPEILIQNRFT